MLINYTCCSSLAKTKIIIVARLRWSIHYLILVPTETVGVCVCVSVGHMHSMGKDRINRECEGRERVCVSVGESALVRARGCERGSEKANTRKV